MFTGYFSMQLKRVRQQPSPAAKSRCVWVAAAVVAILFANQSAARAQGSLDRILRRNGSDSGKITAITSQEVTISKGGVLNRIPSEEIRNIYFAGEPAGLNQARLAAGGGRFEEAARILGGIDRSEIKRDEVQQDIDFYNALCSAKLASSGQGDLAEAIRQVTNFLTRQRASYHVPAAIELLGNLLMDAGKYEEARKQFVKLGKARSPIYKMRSSLLVGRSLQEEEKHAAALVEFEKVLQSAATGPAAEGQKLEALLGKAVSQAATGAADEAVQAITQVIASAEPEDAKLHARAYNALGDCRLSQGNKKAALFAFLHVDLLYSKVPAQHAKALHELTDLWQSLGYKSRAREAQKKLKQRYPGSRWARQ